MRAFVVAAFAAVLSVTPPVSAAGTVPFALPAPPPPGAPAASTIRDAMMAIERAATNNPSAAQTAAFSYSAAMQQYDAHEYERARASAVTAIGQAGAPAAPGSAAAPTQISLPSFPGPRSYVIPDELPATASNAQSYVALARRAMERCLDVKAADAEYRGARSALDAKQYRIAMADARNIVDDCSVR
jgi:hypothetical protein